VGNPAKWYDSGSVPILCAAVEGTGMITGGNANLLYNKSFNTDVSMLTPVNSNGMLLNFTERIA
jgi:hypothetical protein